MFLWKIVLVIHGQKTMSDLLKKQAIEFPIDLGSRGNNCL